MRKNLDYYDRRTSHGSTLSFVAHAGVLARVDQHASWESFMVALESDVGDVQGGTTAEGIHLGVMAGTLDLVQRGYLGEEVRDGVLTFRPARMEHLEGLVMPLRFRGARMEVALGGGRLRVTAKAVPSEAAVRVGVGEDVRDLGPGDSHTFDAF
jgi:trehalose/maltose hydrolase-like predicted phosphorylase